MAPKGASDPTQQSSAEDEASFQSALAATEFADNYDIAGEFEELRGFCTPTFCQEELGKTPDGRPTRALDSTNLGPAHWTLVSKFIASHAEKFDGFVVMQGTDTLAYTAAALAFALKDLRKPVVLSGAQISKGEPGSDARNNVVNAFRVACLRSPQPPFSPILRQVAVVFGSRIIRGTRCRKYSERDLEAFDTANAPLLGRIRLQIRMDPSLEHTQALVSGSTEREDTLPCEFDPRVSMLYLHPGLRPEIVEAVGRASSGLVLAAFGAGNVPCSTADYANPLALVPVIQSLVSDDIPVVITTQCVTGQAEVGLYETGDAARQARAIVANDMTPEAAYVKLAWVLGNGQAWPKKAIQALRGGPGRIGAIRTVMLTPIAGELVTNADLRGPFDAV
jgi:L-asparaginase